MGSKYITVDKDQEVYYAWECEFGTWDHYHLTTHDNLPQLMKLYPEALVSEETLRHWKDNHPHYAYQH
jgi:hypothetical protein